MKVPLEALSPLQVGSLGADTPMQVCAPEEHQLNSKESPGEIMRGSAVIVAFGHVPSQARVSVGDPLQVPERQVRIRDCWPSVQTPHGLQGPHSPSPGVQMVPFQTVPAAQLEVTVCWSSKSLLL